MKNSSNRKMFRNKEAKRDVIIAYENSDAFQNARLIDHSSNFLRFESATTYHPGDRIYIITNNKPIDDFDDKFTEAYFAEVVWCKKIANQYCIGALIQQLELSDI